MTKRIRIGLWIGILVVAGVVMIRWGLPRHPQPRGAPIVVGAVLSMSGAGEFIGAEVQHGFQLALDELNARGGVNGRPLKVVIEDSRSDPDEGKQAFQRLEQTVHPLLTLAVTSTVVTAIAPLAEEQHVPFIGLITGITEQFFKGKHWSFRTYTTTESLVAGALVPLERLKIKRLGILYLDDPYGQSMSRYTQQLFESKGGTVVLEPFSPKATHAEDLAPHVAKLSTLEAIFVVGWDPHLKAAFIALREAQYPGVILAPDTATLPDVRQIPEATGVYVPAPAIYNPNFIFAREVKEKYEARYQRPFTHYAAKGYDFLMMLAQLLEGRPVSRESIRDALEGGFVYSGVFGILSPKRGSHELGHSLSPAQIKAHGELKYF